MTLQYVTTAYVGTVYVSIVYVRPLYVISAWILPLQSLRDLCHRNLGLFSRNVYAYQIDFERKTGFKLDAKANSFQHTASKIERIIIKAQDQALSFQQCKELGKIQHIFLCLDSIELGHSKPSLLTFFTHAFYGNHDHALLENSATAL